MSYVLEVPTETGESVFVEIRETAGVERLASPASLVEKSKATLETLLKQVRPLARAAKAALIDTGPDEMTIEIGVNLTMGGSVVFASTSSEANFALTLTWKQAAK
jgi:hypothetical protein